MRVNKELGLKKWSCSHTRWEGIDEFDTLANLIEEYYHYLELWENSPGRVTRQIAKINLDDCKDRIQFFLDDTVKLRGKKADDDE